MLGNAQDDDRTSIVNTSFGTSRGTVSVAVDGGSQKLAELSAVLSAHSSKVKNLVPINGNATPTKRRFLFGVVVDAVGDQRSDLSTLGEVLKKHVQQTRPEERRNLFGMINPFVHTHHRHSQKRTGLFRRCAILNRCGLGEHKPCPDVLPVTRSEYNRNCIDYSRVKRVFEHVSALVIS